MPRRRVDNDGREIEGQGGRLASWAEETAGFDAPEVVAKSLAGGRVAYRGTISPDALTLVEIPSEGASRFSTAVRDGLELDDADLGPLPALAYCAVEVARAYALGETMVELALTVAGVTKPGRPTVRSADGALRLRDDLSRLARDLNRAADVNRAMFVRDAASCLPSLREPSCSAGPVGSP